MKERKIFLKGVFYLAIFLAVGFLAFYYNLYYPILEKNIKDPILLSPQGVEYNGNSLSTTYSAGNKIKGNVNLSFNNALANYNVTSNFQGEISLLKLLENNGFSVGEEFNCSSPNCLNDYSKQEQVTSIQVNNQGKTVGFSISGEDVSEIESVNLEVAGNGEESCYVPQLYGNVLDSEEFQIISTKSSGNECSQNYEGCFDSGASSSDVIIGSNEYCEQITLPSAPAFKVYAKVKNSTSGTRELKMRLYHEEGDFLGECVLPEPSQNGTYQAIGCIINHTSIYQDNYFACITAGQGDSNANYKIKFENSAPVCGTGTSDFNNLNVDYDIFAKAIGFAGVDFEISESFEKLHGYELSNYIEDYIFDKYNSNCQPECNIPINFLSAQEQAVSFSETSIIYIATQGTTESNSIYSMNVEEPTLSSGILEIDLEKANFTIPVGSEDDKFELFIDGESVFETPVNISASFNFDISPKVVPFGQNILFGAVTGFNITNSAWDFGDGSQIVNTNTKQATHRYLKQGFQKITVTLTRSDGITSTKDFEVLVGDPAEFVNSTISEYKKRIANLSSQINNYPAWIRQAIEQKLDVSLMNASLKTLEQEYLAELNQSDPDFITITNSLLNLKVPKSIEITSSGTGLPLVAGFSNMDVSYIEELSGETVSEKDKLKSQITGWMNENLDSVISFEHVDAILDDGQERILSKFKIETRAKEPIDDNVFLVFGYNVNEIGGFMNDYGASLVGDSNYLTLNIGQTNEIFEFYVFGDFEPEELGAYISPQISRLGDFDDSLAVCNFDDVCEKGRGENTENCPADCGKGRWGWFALWIVILLVCAFIVYIILQEWYKRYYQKHLFKNENDLYNLVNFIYNARKSGITNSGIKAKLKDAGWSGEQVVFALRKIDGKRTGMYEIPLLKFFENRKVKKEISKRQGGRIDTRFIKQQTL